MRYVKQIRDRPTRSNLWATVWDPATPAVRKEPQRTISRRLSRRPNRSIAAWTCSAMTVPPRRGRNSIPFARARIDSGQTEVGRMTPFSSAFARRERRASNRLPVVDTGRAGTQHTRVAPTEQVCRCARDRQGQVAARWPSAILVGRSARRPKIKVAVLGVRLEAEGALAIAAVVAVALVMAGLLFAARLKGLVC